MRTQPVVLLGRIGSRIRYQVWSPFSSTPASTSTMFVVPSVVVVSSRVTTGAASLGERCTSAGRKTPAQRATVALVKPKRCGS